MRNFLFIVGILIAACSGQQTGLQINQYQLYTSACSWEDASSYCASQGGYLACIETQAECDYINGSPGLNPGGNTQQWVGLRRPQGSNSVPTCNEHTTGPTGCCSNCLNQGTNCDECENIIGSFVWDHSQDSYCDAPLVTQCSITPPFTNGWKNGCPSTVGDDCGTRVGSSGFEDECCSDSFPFICEFDLGACCSSDGCTLTTKSNCITPAVWSDGKPCDRDTCPTCHCESDECRSCCSTKSLNPLSGNSKRDETLLADVCSVCCPCGTSSSCYRNAQGDSHCGCLTCNQ